MLLRYEELHCEVHQQEVAPLEVPFLYAACVSPRHSAINILVESNPDRILRGLTNSDEFQVVVLGPVNQPWCECVHGTSICLMHEWYMAIAPSTCLGKFLLALLRGLVVPVTRVDVVCDHTVS